MAKKEELQSWILDALKKSHGSASYITIAKEIWHMRELELKKSGDLFFTWQYDMRWAANRLRRAGKLKNAEDSPRGIWELI